MSSNELPPQVLQPIDAVRSLMPGYKAPEIAEISSISELTPGQQHPVELSPSLLEQTRTNFKNEIKAIVQEAEADGTENPEPTEYTLDSFRDILNTSGIVHPPVPVKKGEPENEPTELNEIEALATLEQLQQDGLIEREPKNSDEPDISKQVFKLVLPEKKEEHVKKKRDLTPVGPAHNTEGSNRLTRRKDETLNSARSRVRLIGRAAVITGRFVSGADREKKANDKIEKDKTNDELAKFVAKRRTKIVPKYEEAEYAAAAARNRMTRPEQISPIEKASLDLAQAQLQAIQDAAEQQRLSDLAAAQNAAEQAEELRKIREEIQLIRDAENTRNNPTPEPDPTPEPEPTPPAPEAGDDTDSAPDVKYTAYQTEEEKAEASKHAVYAPTRGPIELGMGPEELRSGYVVPEAEAASIIGETDEQGIESAQENAAEAATDKYAAKREILKQFPEAERVKDDYDRALNYVAGVYRSREPFKRFDTMSDRSLADQIAPGKPGQRIYNSILRDVMIEKEIGNDIKIFKELGKHDQEAINSEVAERVQARAQLLMMKLQDAGILGRKLTAGGSANVLKSTAEIMEIKQKYALEREARKRVDQAHETDDKTDQ